MYLCRSDICVCGYIRGVYVCVCVFTHQNGCTSVLPRTFSGKKLPRSQLEHPKGRTRAFWPDDIG